ncbi:MAG: O-antigen ligase family protein [Candidatus Omnitrophica bacterium]|nr:O-antigen ligase family protein [Candidatus Omnitrophota bacterium]
MKMQAAARSWFNQCSGPEKVLLYSMAVPASISTHRVYELAYDCLVYQEFFWALVIGLAVLALCVQLFRRKRGFGVQIEPEPYRFLYLVGALYCLWTLISAWWAPSRFWALEFGASWIGFLVYLWLLAAALRHEPFRNLFLAGTFGILSLLSAVNIAGYFASGFRRVEIFGINRLLGAELLAALLPVSAGLFLCHPRRGLRGIGLASYFLFCWAILETGERSPFLGLVVGGGVALVVLIWLYNRLGANQRGGFNAGFWRRLGLIILLAEALTYAQTTPSLLNGFGRAGTNLASRLQQAGFADTSLRARFQYWTACLGMFKDSPVAGHGAGSFRLLYRSYRAQYLRQGHPFGYFVTSESTTAARAHCEYIQVLAEQGIVGLGLFLLFIGLSLGLPLKRIFEWKAGRFEGVIPMNTLLGLFALTGSVAFYLSIASSSFGFRTSPSVFGYVVAMGLALAMLAPANLPAGQEGPSAPEAENRPSLQTVPARVGAMGLLCVMSLIVYASFKVLMGDLYYWKFGVGNAESPSDLAESIAWFPQNPGPHAVTAQIHLRRLLEERGLLEDLLERTLAAKADGTLKSREILHSTFNTGRIREILDQYDVAYRNGLCVSTVPVFKAVAAEAVFQPKLAHSIIEAALTDFPDAPFLGAYYFHLSRKIGQDDAVTRKRLELVTRFQAAAFRNWQTYFEGTKEEADANIDQYPNFLGRAYFHSFYREIRDR